MTDYVLVVDDDPDVRNMIVEALCLFGLEVRNAGDGQQALAMMRENPPQAILLDLMMPTLNGFSTLTRLQRDRALRVVPIILLSGLADNVPSIRQLPGVVGVLCKGDFSMDGLRAALKHAGVHVH